MKLFFQYCSFGFSNCFILGAENKENEAIIIDPGTMDAQILKTIENNNLNLRAVLLTHDHLGHVRGLRTLKRIYTDTEIFAVNRVVLDYKTTMVKDGDKLALGGFTIEVISIPGHSADSVVYLIDTMLFTGDVLTAGLVGGTVSTYGTTTQMNKLRSRLLSLPGDYLVFPGHGPPSTLEAERRFNADINQYNYKTGKRLSLRPAFRLNI